MTSLDFADWSPRLKFTPESPSLRKVALVKAAVAATGEVVEATKEAISEATPKQVAVGEAMAALPEVLSQMVACC